MSLANKSFRNNRTGEIVKVIDSFENIAVLENKQKIDTRALMDSNQYTEQIDPSSFFNNQGAYNILADKIKNISTANMRDEDGTVPVSVRSDMMMPSTNESAVIMTNEDDEKAELIRKYGAVEDNANAMARQQEAFSRLLQDDNEVEDEQPIINQPVKRVTQTAQETINRPVEVPKVEDPIITMFRKTKRGVDFSISLDINDKIPRIDFIEMMEDSYEISMIDFLADEFTNKIIENPDIIKNKIKDKIKEIVYGKTKDVNSQITDSVTQKYDSLTIEKEPVLSKDLPKKVSGRKPKPNIGEKPGYKSPRKKETN